MESYQIHCFSDHTDFSEISTTFTQFHSHSHQIQILGMAYRPENHFPIDPNGSTSCFPTQSSTYLTIIQISAKSTALFPSLSPLYSDYLQIGHGSAPIHCLVLFGHVFTADMTFFPLWLCQNISIISSVYLRIIQNFQNILEDLYNILWRSWACSCTTSTTLWGIDLLCCFVDLFSVYLLHALVSVLCHNLHSFQMLSTKTI